MFVVQAGSWPAIFSPGCLSVRRPPFGSMFVVLRVSVNPAVPSWAAPWYRSPPYGMPDSPAVPDCPACPPVDGQPQAPCITPLPISPCAEYLSDISSMPASTAVPARSAASDECPDSQVFVVCQSMGPSDSVGVALSASVVRRRCRIRLGGMTGRLTSLSGLMSMREPAPVSPCR